VGPGLRRDDEGKGRRLPSGGDVDDSTHPISNRVDFFTGLCYVTLKIAEFQAELRASGHGWTAVFY
jgi:hypothetical protein